MAAEGERDVVANDLDQAAGHARLRYHLVVGDVVGLLVAFGSVTIVHGGEASQKIVCVAIAVICTLGALSSAGLYGSRACAMQSVDAERLIVACAVGAAAFGFSQWLTGPVSAGDAAAGCALAAALILALRWRFARWLKTRRRGGHYLRRVILVGTNEDAEDLYNILSDEPELGYRVAAVAGTTRSEGPWAELPACAEVGELGPLAAQTGATDVIVVATALDTAARSQALHQALACGLHVQLWTGLSGVVGRRTRMASLAGVSLCDVEPQKTAPWQVGTKRLMDLLVASVTSILVAPLLLLAALLIRLEDGGPALYRHRVVGRFGEPITVLKLRTMVQNASSMLPGVVPLNERVGGPLFKATDDPRVTRIGRVLRATSIDELPQLWNVLNGTMSMVGPRFALPSEVEEFDEELRRRHQMRPGITGLWQSEARDNPSFSAYRRLDLLYIDNWSLRLDITILLNTLHAVCARALRELHGVVGRRGVEARLPAAPSRHLPDSGVPLSGSVATANLRQPGSLAPPGYQPSPRPLLRVVGKDRRS